VFNVRFKEWAASSTCAICYVESPSHPPGTGAEWLDSTQREPLHVELRRELAAERLGGHLPSDVEFDGICGETRRALGGNLAREACSDWEGINAVTVQALNPGVTASQVILLFRKLDYLRFSGHLTDEELVPWQGWEVLSSVVLAAKARGHLDAYRSQPLG